MTTVYSPQYAPYDSTSGYLRAGITYSTTETQDSVIFSGTLILQHKGAALSDAYWGGWSAGIDYEFGYIRSIIAETADIASISAHSTWTTIASVQFSKTFDKRYSSYIQNCRLGIVTDLIMSSISKPYEEINIEIPALESWDVTYDANGGTNVPSSQKKYYGRDLTLSSSKPSRANYDFYHWNTQPNNSGTTYEPGATYTGNATLALYAIWNAQVRYNMNGGVAPSGSGLAGTQKKTYGVNLTLLTAVPTRTGYTFDGWNTAADGSGTPFQPGGTYSAEVSVTLYAQWLSLPAKPSIPTMTAIRWNETTDQQDDTGTSAKVTAEWNIDTTSEYYGNTNTGTVTLTVTPQSGSSSHTITPVSGTSGASGTAVFMVSGLDTDMQYTCKVTVTDLNASSERSVILTRAFFIMDFKAGGQGIGIGRAAPSQGLEVGYETVFDDDVTVYDGVYTQDSTGFVFPMMRYNGSNMWYGAIDSSHQSFKGYTYISTGYNGSAGYPSIRVAIPKANNSGSNLYDVWNANHSPINYATCTTAATEQVKIATVYPTTKTFLLTQGVVVGVKFTNTNTYSATTSAPCRLNVNGTGAKNIYWSNTATPTGTNTTAFGRANYINYYMYDGTNWVWLSSSSDNNTTYSEISEANITNGSGSTTGLITGRRAKKAVETFAPVQSVNGQTGNVEIADYIVEQGTATPDSYGTWTYRKWNSGVAECWRDFSSNSFAPATAVGGFYGRVLGTYYFPTDLFIEAPKGFFNLSSWGTGYFWGQMRATSATTYQLTMWRNDNASSTGSGSIHAIGKWK